MGLPDRLAPRTRIRRARTHERKKPQKAKPAKPRRELKRFGGYLEDETLEKIALLRIRLKLDNSQIIKRAIDDLARKHNAAKAFGGTLSGFHGWRSSHAATFNSGRQWASNRGEA